MLLDLENDYCKYILNVRYGLTDPDMKYELEHIVTYKTIIERLMDEL